MANQCKFCNSDKLEKINTYKSFYYLCNNCLCSERKTKIKAPLQYLETFFNFFSFNKLSRLLTITKKNNNYSGSSLLNPYSKLIDNYLTNNDVNKWSYEKCYKELFELIDKNKLIKKDRINFLEISGVPGIQGCEMLKKHKNIDYFTTEFEKDAVDLMKEKLNLNCFLLDLNNIKVEQSIKNKKFDIIYIFCSGLFSHNLDNLLKYFKLNLSDDGAVIFGFGKNTIGTHFRNMFDEFTHNYQISNNQLIKIFRKNNFYLKDYYEWGYSDESDKNGKLTNMFKGQNIIKSAFIIFYLFLNYKIVSKTLNLSKSPVTYVYKVKK